MTLPRLYYQAMADRLARQLRASLGSSYEPTIVTQTATVLNAREIAIAGQRYPLDTSGLAVTPGSSLVVTNIGRPAAARFAPAQTSGSFAISGGAQISPGAIPFGSITADMLTVNMLSAIAANMGYLNAGSIVIGTDNRLWLNDANDGGLAIGGNAKAAAPFTVDKYGNVVLKTAQVGDPTGLHLYADPTLLEFRNGDTVLSGFDAQGRTIYGFERMGPPHGPCVEMAEFTDETGETRYKWQILGENGVPGISFVTGNATDPDDYRIMFGPEGATYYMKFLSGVLTLAASVIILGGSIDKPLTLGLEGGIYQGTGTFAAPTTGLKLWNDGGVGRIAGFNAGVEQVGFASDGKLKWAAGKGVADATGLEHVEDADNYLTLKPDSFNFMQLKSTMSPTVLNVLACGSPLSSNNAIIGENLRDASGATGVLGVGKLGVVGNVGNSLTNGVGVTGIANTNGSVGVKAIAGIDATTALEISGGIVDGGSQRYTALADATADTDALNRRTGDARYAPIAGAHAAVTLATDAQVILNLSTQKIGLVAQPANRVFAGPASGADADPTMRVLVAADLPAEALLTDGTRTGATSQAQPFTIGITLPTTTTDATGIIFKSTSRFLHDFHHPTGSGALPIGKNVFLGVDAGNFTMGSTATEVYHASYNIGIGLDALKANTTGYNNIAIGANALDANTTGDSNVALGAHALGANISGQYNTAIGVGAAQNNTGTHNLALGINALFSNTSGANNVAIGPDAIFYNQTGNDNTVIGFLADGFAAGGVNNHSRMTVIGSMAGYNNTTGTDGVYIGFQAGYRQTTATNLLIIDNRDRSSAALEATNALIYGVFAATVANQSLVFNAGSMGFFGHAAAAQPTTSGGAATFSQLSGNAVNDASTFDGYTMGQVVKALRDIGVLA